MIMIIKLNQFKAHTSLLECVISLVFHVEHEFTPYAAKFLPVLIEFIACNEWSTKKVAIDAIYSMTAIVKEEIIPFRLDILQVLNHCRFDKIKPVREATLETIKLIKEIGPPLEEDLIEEKLGKTSKVNITQSALQRDKNQGGQKTSRGAFPRKGDGSLSNDEGGSNLNVQLNSLKN
jgi:hypothetical protein